MDSKLEMRNGLGWCGWLTIMVGMVCLIFWGLAIYPVTVTAHDLLTQHTCDAAMAAGLLGSLMLGAGIPIFLVSVILSVKAKAITRWIRAANIILPAVAILLGTIFLLVAT